ncbi:hypothetical protein M0R45_017610 [Rubus argutus]|uniref:CCHC-type domain-containing protein n=1 Tax=Rubus argutus TaxID=59490 RepID=A0AAW1XYK8_RUBAR
MPTYVVWIAADLTLSEGLRVLRIVLPPKAHELAHRLRSLWHPFLIGQLHPWTYKNTFAHVWVRFWDLGYAYWEHQTLFEIAKGVGMPIKLDPRTADRSLGLYARILVELISHVLFLISSRFSVRRGTLLLWELSMKLSQNVCGLCGLVGHLGSNCKVKVHLEENISFPKRGRSVAQKHVESDSGVRIDSTTVEKEAFAAEKEVLFPASPIEVGLVTAPVMNVVTAAADALSSSTIDSVPPGFLVKHLEKRRYRNTSFSQGSERYLFV